MSAFAMLCYENVLWLAGSITLLFVLNIYLSYQRVLKSINNHPDIRTFFAIDGIPSNVLPPIPGISSGNRGALWPKYSEYAKRGWDVLTAVSLYPRPSVAVRVADPLAIKEIMMNRSRFPKSPPHYKSLLLFGKNVIVTDGEEWKQHRKITAPVFSDRNNKLVWDESVRLMMEIFESWGKDNHEVVIDRMLDITVPIALYVLCVAGLGLRISWKNDDIPAGHKLSFIDAVHTVTIFLELKQVIPLWIFPFFKFLRRGQLASHELEIYMKEMVDARRSSTVKGEGRDLFSLLLDENDNGASKLTDRDIIGNIFIFLLAGQESTAHSLLFCMGLLALDQEEQERLYQHIISVLPHGEVPSYEHMNLLSHSLAAFNETLRLYPPVPNIVKVSAEDTTIPTIRPDGTKEVVPIPKGATVLINAPGLHYNPRYWPDPEAFKPSRFLGDWSRDAFLPFSGGPRACMGRKFAETEAVAILTLFVSKYRIELKDPESYEGLTYLERRAKLLVYRAGITLTPLNVPLVFKKR